MDLRQRRFTEDPLAKTKIVATVGPACGEEAKLRQLVEAGVDVFRLNFAHGKHEWLAGIVAAVRRISAELKRPVGLLADLSGPKIRLGQLPEEGVLCGEEDRIEFVRGDAPYVPKVLTCTYPQLIDDLKPGDRVLLADGMVALRVMEKAADGSRVVCGVEQPGTIRSRQGINLPGVTLSTPALTEKDREDLAWALKHEIDFLSLSFVRSPQDIRLMREVMASHNPTFVPQIVAKIEKMEAIDCFEEILAETDVVMVARGDLGVEVDVARVPMLQKRIIRQCKQHRVPVITATQMLESMQKNELPTRAEASDVANAVLDGTDAVMLSGETAVGSHPALVVSTMSRIAREAERMLTPTPIQSIDGTTRTRARLLTEAVTLGAGAAAENLKADLIVVASQTGRTAMALSKQRLPMPILALTDNIATARRMCLYWGITPLLTSTTFPTPQETLGFVIGWGQKLGVLKSGSRIVVVGRTESSVEGHDLMLVHVIP